MYCRTLKLIITLAYYTVKLILHHFHLGTTWVQEIVWQIFNEGQVKSSHILERVPFLEMATSTGIVPQPDFNTLPSPRILKTHLPYYTVPKSAT